MYCRRIDVLTLFPQMFQALDYGVASPCRDAIPHSVIDDESSSKLADKQAALQLVTWNIRDYAQNASSRVDDRPFGGGAGMLLQIDPLQRALAAAQQAAATPAKVILLAPQGKPLQQKDVQRLSKTPRLLLIAGRYEGIDQRFIDAHVEESYSVGDFVVSGGELPAMMLIDAVSRLLPGVLGNPQSVVDESFVQGLLEGPQYTRPGKHALGDVPKVLLTGDHAAIARWRQQQALFRTWQRRPDMLKKLHLNAKQKSLLQAAIDVHHRHGDQESEDKH